jgi:hypothetical protein
MAVPVRRVPGASIFLAKKMKKKKREKSQKRGQMAYTPRGINGSINGGFLL